MKRHAWLLLLSLLLAFPASAQVVRGYASVGLNLRAGPDIGYPVVDLIPGGASLYVHGCTVDWSWCDVSVYGERGWIAGDFIDYPYGGRWVSVYDYGGFIGIPVISFVIGNYWHAHYRHRHFYHQRHYWYRHRFAYHRVPRYHHDRRRLADAFRHHDRRYRDDDDRRVYRRHDRDRREHRRYLRDRRTHVRHDRDARRTPRYRGQVHVYREPARTGHKRRLAPTVARNALPRGARPQTRVSHRSYGTQPRRLGSVRPRTAQHSLASNAGFRHAAQPTRHRPVRTQRHQGHRQASHRAQHRRHANHGKNHHRRNRH